MENNGDQSAFPFATDGMPQLGLTKREYFAGQALAGLLATERPYQDKPWEMAARSVELADILIQTLNK